ncbi:T3SS effector HopA1 family protein [Streptomyces sp. AC550_RSS872]|uniref:T3SS effector HopA1 family protein n=1 Tax=Streptomyces sp. AC550_RSS872 TaxID=2823689 RepID=UPI001C2561BC|nr:T3SS effector HopA1 family protein [Streptomyces sp. AC550_RSS872]
MTADRDNSYLRLFQEIAEEVVIQDARTFTHPRFGTLEPPRDMETNTQFPVVTYLSKLIYLTYYAGDEVAARMLVEGGKAVAAIPDHEDYAFAERLHAHNTGRGHLVPGWQVTGRRGNAWLVQRDGLTLSAPSSDLVPDEPTEPAPSGGTANSELQVGGQVSVRFPPCQRYSVLGWYMAIGDHGAPSRDEGLVRLYFSLDGPEGAPSLMRTLTSALNRLELPFQFKMANHPSAYTRRDSGVLYLSRQAWSTHRQTLLEVCDEADAVLRNDYPRLALPLRPGVSFAVEPQVAGHRLSFGEHRCLLVAEALVTAYEQGVRDLDGRVAAIRERYAREGLDLEAPYADPMVVA